MEENHAVRTEVAQCAKEGIVTLRLEMDIWRTSDRPAVEGRFIRQRGLGIALLRFYREHCVSFL